MSWIDERIEQRKNLMFRNGAVRSGAEGIFNDLWNGILVFVKEAESKNLDVRTNGSSFERAVFASAYLHGNRANQRELTIKLDRENEKITVSGPEKTFDLSIDLCEDSVVCLKYEGKKVLIEQAARLILDPFLFPELQHKKIR